MEDLLDDLILIPNTEIMAYADDLCIIFMIKEEQDYKNIEIVY